jgi:hypothetical protein
MKGLDHDLPEHARFCARARRHPFCSAAGWEPVGAANLVVVVRNSRRAASETMSHAKEHVLYRAAEYRERGKAQF